MAVYKRGRVWWYRFTWRRQALRGSTKLTNKRDAEHVEAAYKTSLAKGEMGLAEKKSIPTLREFAINHFIPHIENQFAEKRTTLAYYQIQVGHLSRYSGLANARVDSISPDLIAGFVGKWREAGYEVSSINRALQVLRRMLRLAAEWGYAGSKPPRVPLLPGERRRERVLSPSEQTAYLVAAGIVGEEIVGAYQKALQGIRAAERGLAPIKPEDPYLLRDVFTILLDCGLRPEECYRLRWDQIRLDALHIEYGKTANARRSIPLTKRAEAALEMRRSKSGRDWVFPAPTKSGHIEQWTLRKQHQRAYKIAGIAAFPFYTLRHTCLTKWSQHMDPYTLAYFAGHSDFGTTRRYVHPNLESGRAAMERANVVYSGHNSGHSQELPTAGVSPAIPVFQ